MHTNATTRRHPLAMFVAWLFIVFLVLLPKGGIKVGDVPLTWGYFALAVSAPPLLLWRLLTCSLRMPKAAWLTLALLLPFQVLFVYGALVNGIDNLSYTLSTILNVFFLPWLFVVVYGPLLRLLDGARLAGWLRTCIFLTALWGILLFVWHPLTGHFLEIKYLTVNGADYGNLEYTKHINRGYFFKLISTYNNGNLYGVCMLILTPLYNRLEPKLWKRNTLRLALLLTLSRTVWFGLVAEQALSVLALFVREARSFPRVRPRRSTRAMIALAATALFILTGLVINSASWDFLFDPTAGGRVGEAAGLLHGTWLPSLAIGPFQEVLYFSAARFFGYAGLAAFTLMLFSPLLTLLADRSTLHSPLRRAALKGLVLYIALAAVDGAYNLIPTQVFYWFLFAVLLYGWPQRKAQTATATAEPALRLDAAGA